MAGRQGPGGGWAKARTFTDPAERAALHRATDEDRRRYMVDAMVPVACERCGTEVLVRKLTAQHTSVQWQDEPAATCPRFAEWAGTGTPTALRDGCPDLDSSIVHAVRAGRVEVPEEDDPAAGSADTMKD
ncbi:hypothetical protein [Tomitella gaofuii]|uniref:hypothetical protein n=1 Tax=Tomitella gaofuii TaxID=2760083 RepID=UPI0015F8E51D|nr:hypothetical protein [Tomitella gaofuii]